MYVEVGEFAYALKSWIIDIILLCFMGIQLYLR